MAFERREEPVAFSGTLVPLTEATLGPDLIGEVQPGALWMHREEEEALEREDALW